MKRRIEVCFGARCGHLCTHAKQVHLDAGQLTNLARLMSGVTCHNSHAGDLRGLLNAVQDFFSFALIAALLYLVASAYYQLEQIK